MIINNFRIFVCQSYFIFLNFDLVYHYSAKREQYCKRVLIWIKVFLFGITAYILEFSNSTSPAPPPTKTSKILQAESVKNWNKIEVIMSMKDWRENSLLARQTEAVRQMLSLNQISTVCDFFWPLLIWLTIVIFEPKIRNCQFECLFWSSFFHEKHFQKLF